MANGAAFHKFTDSRGGLSSGGSIPLGALLWKGGTTWAAGAVVQNGNFLFTTAAGGAGAASGIGPTRLALVDASCTWTVMGSCSGLSAIETTPSQELGFTAAARDFGPNAYGAIDARYTKFTGAAAITAGSFVVFDGYGQTCTASPTAAPGSNKGSLVGIAMGSPALNVTSPLYGWVMVRGVYDGANVITTFTAGAVLSGSATAGAAIGNAVAPTANYLFDLAILRAGSAVGACSVEVYWPICTGR